MISAGPEDGVFVEGLEVAGAVVADEFLNRFFLLKGLGVWEGFFKILNNALDGRRIEAANHIGYFHHFVAAFHHFGVQTVGNRSGVVGIFDCVEIILDFFLRHALIHVVGRCDNDVGTFSLIYAFGKECGVEYEAHDAGHRGFEPLHKFGLRFVEVTKLSGEPVSVEFRCELVGALEYHYHHVAELIQYL